MTLPELTRHILDTYGVEPDHPFPRDDQSCVFRHLDNRKWFALTMHIPYKTLGIPKEGSTDVINIKCDPVLAGSLRQKPGFYPAYHMNKELWITVLLDGSVAAEDIIGPLALSYDLTTRKPRRRKSKGDNEDINNDTD